MKTETETEIDTKYNELLNEYFVTNEWWEYKMVRFTRLDCKN